jgi:hypothetical protein
MSPEDSERDRGAIPGAEGMHINDSTARILQIEKLRTHEDYNLWSRRQIVIRAKAQGPSTMFKQTPNMR